MADNSNKRILRQLVPFFHHCSYGHDHTSGTSNGEVSTADVRQILEDLGLYPFTSTTKTLEDVLKDLTVLATSGGGGGATTAISLTEGYGIRITSSVTASGLNYEVKLTDDIRTILMNSASKTYVDDKIATQITSFPTTAVVNNAVKTAVDKAVTDLQKEITDGLNNLSTTLGTDINEIVTSISTLTTKTTDLENTVADLKTTTVTKAELASSVSDIETKLTDVNTEITDTKKSIEYLKKLIVDTETVLEAKAETEGANALAAAKSLIETLEKRVEELEKKTTTINNFYDFKVNSLWDIQAIKNKLGGILGLTGTETDEQILALLEANKDKIANLGDYFKVNSLFSIPTNFKLYDNKYTMSGVITYGGIV